MSNLQILNASDFAAEVEATSQPVMVDFYATGVLRLSSWAPPWNSLPRSMTAA